MEEWLELSLTRDQHMKTKRTTLSLSLSLLSLPLIFFLCSSSLLLLTGSYFVNSLQKVRIFIELLAESVQFTPSVATMMIVMIVMMVMIGEL